jgi:hypothetical protein
MSALSEEQRARKNVLFRARNRAQSLLVQRHYAEFIDLKNDILVKWGHAPIEPSKATRTARVSSSSPLDDPIYPPSTEE